MESYEDHTWCSHSYQSEEDDDDFSEGDELPHDPHLAKVRSRSNSRSRRRSSFLVDELDMLMDKAATTIQAAWRGHLTRKQIMAEHAAASIIQAAWRRFITQQYRAIQRDQMPSGQVYGRRRKTPSLVSLEDKRRSRRHPTKDREHAAVVIQAHYRGYVTRRALSECKQAAITIQAHWRGYRTRQELAQSGKRMYRHGSPRGTYYSQPSYVPGSTGWMGPYPRKHWRKVMVGDPEEWGRKRSRAPPSTRERKRVGTTQPKMCPQCGRCSSVRILEGVGKGPPSESEMDDSECESHSSRSIYGRQRSSASKATKSQSPAPRAHSYGAHVSYQGSSRSYYSSTHRVVTEDQPRRQGREPGGIAQRYATGHTSARPTRERNTTRSFSSTNLQQQGAPSPGTSDWLYENYCARRMGEGQRRVFKTRKQLWQVARAATLIQSFWRGWKVRRALAVQQAAATKIQSAYRGYKTRIYLIEAGVLSEGDTE
ncbi:hypothetical protein JD844_015442 [Phrynosoma platyrhinos]|uniref:Uncharacterized protein n=1 Tax=Phrynosoma platyrhinos TaxID=52577 RepID=A0ABQ7SJ64_PHRPL|nr:hypothetical protein JD844_015442 [Phrynosoma platyrhinos]